MEISSLSEARSDEPQIRVPSADKINLFKDRMGVRLSFAGAAFLSIYKERLARIELRPSWVTALAIVSENPEITQSELGRALAINRASAMALAKHLEKNQLITRKSSTGRQRTPLQLTQLGSQKLRKACEIEDEIVSEALEGFTPEQEHNLKTALKRLTVRLNKL